MNSSEERIPGLGMAVAAEQMQTDEVFRVHAARLYPVAFRLTGNASDAEFLVVRHEALLSRMEVEDLRLLAVAAVG
jgi:DNA-directed RNA polymerase specialized sigma24 family protein